MVTSLNTHNNLNPRGEIHIPIGIANSLDGLKTLVEPEGVFSPGFASYGIYCWVYDRDAERLCAPTMDDVPVEYGLGAGGTLVPWACWAAGDLLVKTELCATMIGVDAGNAHFTASRVTLTNDSENTSTVSLYLALRALGPAAGAVPELEISEDGMSLLVDGRLALISIAKPERAGVCAGDFIGEYARQGVMPELTHVTSDDNDCSGALRFSYELPPGAEHTVEFICPVHPGRCISGQQQPLPPLATYTHYPVQLIFSAVNMYWNALAGQVKFELPDPRWGASFTAIGAHIDIGLATCIDANTIEVLQKSGQVELADEVNSRLVSAGITPEIPAISHYRRDLYAGDRAAGYETLNILLEHPRMRCWYAASDDDTSIAEFFLLLRDSLVYEEDGALVLFAGVPEAWFTAPEGMNIADLPTHYDKLTLTYLPTEDGITITLAGAAPPHGYRLRLPAALITTTTREENGDIIIPAGTNEFNFRLTTSD